MAIKIINRREDNEGTIKRERRILLAARDCPFLCHLYAAHQSLERAYFITEYLSGGSLEDLIRICCYLDINNIRFYAAEMVCGLQFLHGQNIVHRDLKPENIMLDAEGHIRIIDLGLAQDGVTASSKIDGVTGTFCYMAPEVLLGQEYYTAVDWWSLGIVLCRMATGRFPFFIGHSKQKVFKAITRKEPKLPPGMDAAIEHLISQLLRKNPDKRPGVRRNIRKHPFLFHHSLGGTGREESQATMWIWTLRTPRLLLRTSGLLIQASCLCCCNLGCSRTSLCHTFAIVLLPQALYLASSIPGLASDITAAGRSSTTPGAACA
ncbi:protein kinase C theta type-like [Hyla sarda]|uniref:protein kinase C theta type-like n=1 Tax=Hyla sarda TaxID=327740 RepID=UPI0024C2D7E5|nr:protein kinase C theta type-like [Hyla sarda]